MGQSKRIFEEQRQHEEQTQSNNALAIRDAEFRLLYRYSIWLEKEGYMDTDWRTEPPTALDQFMAL